MTKQTIIKVEGMHCNSCEMLITDELNETLGVKSSSASHEKGLVNVEYDEEDITLEKIKEVIRGEGYDAR